MEGDVFHPHHSHVLAMSTPWSNPYNFDGEQKGIHVHLYGRTEANVTLEVVAYSQVAFWNRGVPRNAELSLLRSGFKQRYSNPMVNVLEYWIKS